MYKLVLESYFKIWIKEKLYLFCKTVTYSMGNIINGRGNNYKRKQKDSKIWLVKTFLSE